MSVNLNTILGSQPTTTQRPTNWDKFMVPYDKNEQFTGRNNLLQTLEEMLSEVVPRQYNHRVALYGMGGVGKTQTAIAYVYANQDKYDRIYWISAASEATLLSGFQEIGSRTGCAPANANSDPKEVATIVRAWLQTQDNWLVVIDNLDQIDIIKDYLPDRGSRKHTLITTRNPDAKGIPARGLEVVIPDVDDSIEMLCTLAEMDLEAHKDEARQVVEELGCLPLAIDQAASYVRTVTKSFSLFLDGYQKRRSEIHKWVPKGNRQYSYSVANTWSVSFKYLQDVQPITAKLFQVLSFLNPDSILVDFIIAASAAFENDVREFVRDFVKFTEALLSLESLSLIKWSRETNALSIHRVIQAVVEDELSESSLVSCMSTIVEICDIATPADDSNESTAVRRNCQNQVVGPLIRVGKLRTERTAAVSSKVGNLLRIDGKLIEGLKLVMQALDIYSDLRHKEDLDFLGAQIHLATCYREIGNLDEASHLLKTTSAALSRLLGEDHPQTLCALRDLSIVYQLRGLFTETAALQERLLATARNRLGEDDHFTLTIMNNLGTVYDYQGRFPEAVALHEKVLISKQRVLGNDHLSTLNSMACLANTYFQLGNLTQAVELYKKVLIRISGGSGAWRRPPGHHGCNGESW